MAASDYTQIIADAIQQDVVQSLVPGTPWLRLLT